MSDLKEKVNQIRTTAVDLADLIKDANKMGIALEITIGTKQKTVTFGLPDSDIPIFDVEVKATINQDL